MESRTLRYYVFGHIFMLLAGSLFTTAPFTSTPLHAQQSKENKMKLESRQFDIGEYKVSLKLPKSFAFSSEKLTWKSDEQTNFSVYIRFFDAHAPEDEKEDEFRATARAVGKALTDEIIDEKLGTGIKTRTTVFDGKSKETSLWKYFYYVVDDDNVGDILYRVCIMKKAKDSKMAFLSFETTIQVTEDSPVARSKAAVAFEKTVLEMLESFSIE